MIAIRRTYSEVMASTPKFIEPTENPALAEVERKSGPSNFFRVMAYRPEAMEAFVGLYKRVMGPGTLDRRLKEMVYLAVSCVNECDYCTAHHIQGSKAAGLSENDIYAIQSENNQSFTPKEQAALRYARELTRTADLDEETRYPADELFSPEQMVELTMIVGLANFTNRFNNAFDMPVEASAHTAPVPRAVG